jgi:hypothetical protein
MPEAEGLEYEVNGRGEPLFLIHGGHIADGFAPLFREPLLRRRRRRLCPPQILETQMTLTEDYRWTAID